MIALIQREIHSFFGSLIGYLVIAVFLVINGLFLWLFDGPFNILNAGFAELTSFFQLAPWVLLFCMSIPFQNWVTHRETGILEALWALTWVFFFSY